MGQNAEKAFSLWVSIRGKRRGPGWIVVSMLDSKRKECPQWAKDGEPQKAVVPSTIHPFSHFQALKCLLGARLYLACREMNAKCMTSVICVSGPHCECSPPCSLRKDRSLQAEWEFLREGELRRSSLPGEEHQSQRVRFGW